MSDTKNVQEGQYGCENVQLSVETLKKCISTMERLVALLEADNTRLRLENSQIKYELSKYQSLFINPAPKTLSPNEAPYTNLPYVTYTPAWTPSVKAETTSTDPAPPHFVITQK